MKFNFFFATGEKKYSMTESANNYDKLSIISD